MLIRFIILLILLAPAGAMLGQSPSDAEIRRALERLTSPIGDPEAGEAAWLERQGAAAIESRVGDLDSPDADARLRAAQDASLLVSPHRRMLARLGLHRGHLQLGRRSQTYARSRDHPQAAMIRRSALSAFDRLSAHLGATSPYGNLAHEKVAEARALCELLTEVGDDETVDALVERMIRIEEREIVRELARSIESIISLPTQIESRGICGNCSEEEIRQFANDEAERARVGKLAIAKFWRKHRKKSDIARLEAALPLWRKTLETRGSAITVDAIASLLRQDRTALAVTAAWSRVKELGHQQARRVILAALNSELDHTLIQKGLAGDEDESLAALRMIRLADSRIYLEELSTLARSGGPRALEATRVLAICHQTDARKQLRQIASAAPENYMAREALLELEAWED